MKSLKTRLKQCLRKRDPNGEKYKGTENKTKSGRTCQRWDENTPHVPNHRPKHDKRHNFCRNPDGDPRGPWCYTTALVITKKWKINF